jgi:hypothetical protein
MARLASLLSASILAAVSAAASAAAVAAGAFAAAAAREEVDFSYAWRFHFGAGADDIGVGPGGAWQAAFAQTTGACTNMFPDPHRMTSSDCELACAYQPNCSAWFHEPSSRSCSVGYGANVTCAPASSNATATGAQRAAATPLQTSYAFAAASLPEEAGWPLVDAPHDGLAALNGSFCESCGDMRHAYRTRTVLWYRKAFVLPAEWAAGGGAVLLRFEGVLHFAQLWLGGVYLGQHSSSYGAFTVRLDNVSSVAFGQRAVLAVRADAGYGSEHWYGGGGLIRRVILVRAPAVSIVESGVFAPSELPADRIVPLSAELQTFAAAPSAVTVRFDVIDPATGTVLATASSATTTVNPGAATATASAKLALPAAVRAWTVAAPALYTVSATVVLDDGGAVADALNVTAGWRATRWDPDTGFFLNGAPVKQRGFSHHNSFGGVGVAMPQRLDAFRVQAARAMGANIHRMSHNPYREGLYDLLDTLGVLVWNENRDFGPAYAFQMGEMAKRDRNHVAVVVNSLCNEVECVSPPFVGREMVALSKAQDPSRPTTANSNGADGLYAVIDVQGFSHSGNSTFAAAHEARPAQPLVLSECCSCTSQRFPRAPVDDSCIFEQNSPGIDVAYVAGSLGVWTAFDYFGEPPGPWPFVSSSFGQLDLAGMPKPHAHLYTSMWRERVPASDPGRVALPPAPVARVTDLLDQLPPAPGGRGGVTVSGLVSSEFAELIADGVSLGVLASAGRPLTWTVPSKAATAAAAANCSYPTPVNGVQCKGLKSKPAAKTRNACAAAACAADVDIWQFATTGTEGCWIGAAQLPCPPPGKSGAGWVGGARGGGGGGGPKNVTLRALAADRSTVIASHSLSAPESEAPAALALVVDVPSPSTGTGSALFLDGSDVALIRVATVDAAGALVSVTPTNVSFAVVSGPGRIAGVNAGNPAAHEQPNGATVATFGGLARVVVQVTADCTSPLRNRIIAIDVDGGQRTYVSSDGAACAALGPIVVRASAAGLADATVTLQTSVAPADAPLAAAAAAFGTAAVSYFADFLG